jgi:hypothetical protein
VDQTFLICFGSSARTSRQNRTYQRKRHGPQMLSSIVRVRTMPEPRIDLPCCPPIPDERIGDDRAQESIAALRIISAPVVDEAEADLRQRASPGTEIVRSRAPVSYIARFRFDDPQVRLLCVGVVYETRAGDAQQNSIQLDRNGVLYWRRE